MSISFKGVESAKASQGGNYVRPCNVLCRIDKVKEGENRKGSAFIATEMTVFHVFEGEHTCGENITHMNMESWDSFLGNWKAEIMGITGCEESEVTQELSKEMVGSDQPLSGVVTRVKAHNAKTKAGGDFTVVKYEGNLSEEEWREILTEEDIKALGL